MGPFVRFATIPLTLLCGCVSTQALRGDGVARSETRRVPRFEAVHAQMPVALSVVPGEGDEITVTGDGNLLHAIRTRVEGETLVVVEDCDSCTLETRVPVTVVVPGGRVRSWTLEEEASLEATGVKAESLAIVARDRATARLQGVDVDDEVSVVAQGDARVVVAGRAEEVVVEAEDDASVDLSGLAADSGDFELEDEAVARANVTDSAVVEIEDRASLELPRQPERFEASTESSARVRFTR